MEVWRPYCPKLATYSGNKPKARTTRLRLSVPQTKFDATLWPRARCIADPDCDVPDECWLDGNIQIAHQGTIKPERPSIHRISTAKRKSGVSARVVYSWEGLLNNQAGCFGRGLRPPLEWKPGNPLTGVRSATPNGAIRAVSLPDDYRTMCDDFASNTAKYLWIFV